MSTPAPPAAPARSRQALSLPAVVGAPSARARLLAPPVADRRRAPLRLEPGGAAALGPAGARAGLKQPSFPRKNWDTVVAEGMGATRGPSMGATGAGRETVPPQRARRGV